MTTTVFPAFRVSDAAATIELLTALGFTERLIVPDLEDPDRVVHAEFAWGDRGGVMFGSRRGDDSALETARASMYLVVEDDAEVDRLHQIVVARGERIVRPAQDQEHGGRAFDVIDRDGHSYSIGSYPGAA